jgi:hypothetical protein
MSTRADEREKSEEERKLQEEYGDSKLPTATAICL